MRCGGFDSHAVDKRRYSAAAERGRQPASPGCTSTPANLVLATLVQSAGDTAQCWAVNRITVLLADDNLIVREGVRALLAPRSGRGGGRRRRRLRRAGRAGVELQPQVLVTDIRMPPTFQDEGIEGAKEIRKRLPGTGSSC